MSPPDVAVDEELAAALATLVVPDHRPGFWNELGERLIRERQRPAAPAFDPKERVEQVDRRAEAVTEERVRRGPLLRWRGAPPMSPRHPAVAQLAQRAEWVREPPSRRPVVIGLAVFGVAVAVAAAMWVGTDGNTSAETGAEVAARLSRNLSDDAALLGAVEITRPTGIERYNFVRATNGSFRFQGTNVYADTAYDASSLAAGTWKAVPSPDGATVLTASEANGLTGGPPDPDGHFPYLADDDLSRVVRTLEVAGKAKARATTLDGRAALVIEAEQVPTMEDPADHLEVTLDRDELLPMQIKRTAAGRSLETRRFSQLRTTATAPPGSFRIIYPAGLVPTSSGAGFVSTPLPQVQFLVGYPPVTPSWLPAGYELAAVAVQVEPPFGQPSTGGDANPANAGVVSITYRRGLERVTVTTRRTDAAARWVDPFGTFTGVDRRPVRLRGGRFLGTTVEQVHGLPAVSHLWGRTADMVFTVGGDLAPKDMVRLAESLG